MAASVVAKDRNVQVVQILCTLCVCMTTCVGSSSWTPDTLKPISSWTILDNGYLMFEPDLGQTLDFSVSFKTNRPHGMLFCHVFKGLIYMQAVEHLGVFAYKFCALLYKGRIKIAHKLLARLELFYYTNEYNDNKWHTLQVRIDVTTGQLHVSVDAVVLSLDKPMYLNSYTRTKSSDHVDWSTTPTIMIYGGPLGYSVLKQEQFIGCLANLTYVKRNGRQTLVAPTDGALVQEGCHDECEEASPCMGGGLCINQYTHVTCDCFGTNAEGKYCNSSEVSVITLSGYQWFVHNIYTDPKDRLLMSHSRFSLQFKSDRGSGVLIYAVGGYPDESHVIASVHKGLVTVSIAFVNANPIERQMTLQVDDYRNFDGWHNLTITHDLDAVEFILDGHVNTHYIDDDKFYLSFDQNIYFGGGDNFVTTEGLQVTQNFIGCLKNIYFNDQSIIYNVVSDNDHSHLNGGHNLELGCQPVTQIPMSFPRSGTWITIFTRTGGLLNLQMDFRTVRTHALILYLNFMTQDYSDLGNLEVWVKEGIPLVHYVPSVQNQNLTQDAQILTLVNNNQWHSFSLEFQEGNVKLMIGSKSVSLEGPGHELHIVGSISLGFSQWAHAKKQGFVGCVRNLKVQGVDIDPIAMMNKEIADVVPNGVLMDGCHLVDHCKGGPHCDHDSVCMTDWDGVSCDCSNTAYEGLACHFPKFMRTCDEYYRAGHKKNGVYQIDLDAEGPLDPSYVNCHMDQSPEGVGYTVIDHNLPQGALIKGHPYGDIKKVVLYREMNHEKLLLLSELSAHCEQHIEYRCASAPLGLGVGTLMTSANGNIVDYIGPKKHGHCLCHHSNNCPRNGCICDKGLSKERRDYGTNKEKADLPIMSVSSLGNTSTGQGNISLGPLKCYGTESLTMEYNVIHFSEEYAHLTMSPWKSGALEFGFRTFQMKAGLLSQTASHNNSNHLSIELHSEKLVQFNFNIKGNVFHVNISTETKLNDGHWHQVSVMMSNMDVRCTVDMVQQIHKFPQGVKHVSEIFDGLLYLGRIVNSPMMGLVGCVRGFYYNGEYKEIIIRPTDFFVYFGCHASCADDPCQNGAMCVEGWGWHECTCSNSWAHSGHNCEININEEEATFNSSESSFLHMDLGTDFSLLQSTILLSFRTFQERALLFYLYDNYNNFVQLEINNKTTLMLSYNNFDQVQRGFLTVRGLTDGNWKQVIIQFLSEGHLGVKLMVENENHKVIIPYRTLKLSTYAQKPFKGSYWGETVFPVRGPQQAADFVKMYIGGAPNSVTALSRLYGCIRGVKIGDTVLQLRQEASLNPAVGDACQSGCMEFPCRNGGVCREEWGHNDFTCGCDDTDFAGQYCHIEASGLFNGNSVLEYNFQSQPTMNESLSLVFQTNSTDAPMIMTFIFSARHQDHDLLLIYIKPREGIFVSNRQGQVIRGLGKFGNYTDGKPHRLTYYHHSSQFSLKVDDEARETVPNSHKPLQSLDTINVGGVVNSSLLDSFISPKMKLVNFVGCISVVQFEMDIHGTSQILRPLKALRNGNMENVHVHGDDIGSCNIHTDDYINQKTTPTQTTQSTIDGTGLTMPPWEQGPAETVYLNGAPTTPTEPTTTTIPTTTSPDVVTTEEAPRANFTKADSALEPEVFTEEMMAIVLCLIIFFIIIAVIIAIVLRKSKKRDPYKKKQAAAAAAELEMKQKTMYSPVSSAPDPISPLIAPKNDHLAHLDEFSMVSATLGPSLKKSLKNGIKPCTEQPLLPDDHPPDYTMQTFFNKKKNRPASSISEVLEELERQRKSKDSKDLDVGSTDNISQPLDPGSGEAELEWDPQTDNTPLTCDYNHKYPVHNLCMTEEMSEDDSLVSMSLFYKAHLFQKPEEDQMTGDTDSDPLRALEQHKDLLALDNNGDSGYEAESRPDEDQDQMTPHDLSNPHSPGDGKMYMYDIAGFNMSTSVPNGTSTPESFSPRNRDVII